MDRGLKAPLSPHEEVSLRRVALGVAHPADLAGRDVDRLKSLLLIEEVNGGLRLTPLGKQRYLALPKNAGFDTSAPDEGLAKIAEFVTKARD
jgi:hypothetical protein